MCFFFSFTGPVGPTLVMCVCIIITAFVSLVIASFFKVIGVEFSVSIFNFFQD